ncbi:MAG: family 43 glycosylhydrolase, partial [Bacteroidota bacterium]
RHDRLRPYRKLGFGVAVADQIEGPYRVLNPDAPLFKGNHATLVTTPAGRTYVYYDLDGRMYVAKLNLEEGRLMEKPVEMLGPATLGEAFHFLDAPSVYEKNGRYHLLYTQFYGGYVIKAYHLISDQPTGPWRFLQAEPLLSFTEAEASQELQMPYASPNGFAPPTQVVFSHQIFRGHDGQYYLAYHSSEKYAEPYLMIEPFHWEGEQIKLFAPKKPRQTHPQTQD